MKFNIVFDFGGVLIDWNPRYFYRTYFKDEAEMEYFLANICTNEWNAEHDRGRLFSDGVEMLQKKHPEYSDAIRMYKEGWERMLNGEICEGVGLLKDLKREGYPLYGLTNWSAETIGVAYKRFGFLSLFDGIVVSGEEKLIKPDKRLFQVLLDRYLLKAQDCIFIDDNAANIQSANELGFNAVLYDNIKNVRERLDGLLK